MTTVPQRPGAVVEATLTHQGKTGRRVLLRRVPFGDEPPWASEQDVCDRAFWNDADLHDLRVIHLPGPHPSKAVTPASVTCSWCAYRPPAPTSPCVCSTPCSEPWCESARAAAEQEDPADA